MLTKRILSILISLNIAVLLIVPQLNAAHYDPNPQFWAEWIFAVAAITLFVLVVCQTKYLNIPLLVIPLLCFMLFISVQHYWVRESFLGLVYIVSGEMFICVLLTIAISTLIREWGIPKLLSIICLALVVGALLQSAIGFLQYSGLYRFVGDWIFYAVAHPTTNIFGHFGQRNHYCDYLSWAIFSCIYLFQRKRINIYVFYSITLWLIFSITLAASRSVVIYFGLAIFITFMFYVRDKTPTNKKLCYLILIVSIILLLVEFIYPSIDKLFIHQHQHINSGLERLTNDIHAGDIYNSSRRLIEWHKAWYVFMHHPVLGLGWNTFAQQSVMLQGLFIHVPTNSGLFTNAHNLILQLLAETGLIGTMIIMLGIVYAVYILFRQKTIESIIILCVVFTILAHSMVEYPLWYLYFLGPLLMFLSMYQPYVSMARKYVCVIVLLPLMYIGYLMLQAVPIYHTLVAYQDPPNNTLKFIAHAHIVENIMLNNIFWEYSALDTLDNYINIDNNNTNKLFNLERQLAYENQLTNFHPYPENLIKQAMLNWQLGHELIATQQVLLALNAYPVYQHSYLQTLNNARYHKLYNIVKHYQPN